jgi:pilus assembly protein CpaD
MSIYFRRNEMKNAKFLIAATLSLGLSGCGAMGTNTTVYSANQPVVERINYAIDVNADSSSGILPNEKVRLSEWLDALKVGYGDRIAIDFGDSYSSAAAQQVVSQMATDRGILVGDTAPLTAGRVNPGTMRVIVTRSTASVPNCPNWSKTTEANYNMANHPNYGCAVNSNMAAMIADPEDLVRGSEDRKLDSNSGTKAISAHRNKTNGGK